MYLYLQIIYVYYTQLYNRSYDTYKIKIIVMNIYNHSNIFVYIFNNLITNCIKQNVTSVL